MKPNQLFTSLLVAAAMLASSCSTSKMASTDTIQDDVYNTEAQAKVYTPPPVNQEAPSRTSTSETDEYYGLSDPYYDMDYTSRIHRFYYGSPWRTYYDGYYGYSPYYNYMWDLVYPFYGGYYGMNSFYNPYWSWRYYGTPYYTNVWGPYSYYNPFYGGYYGGYYGGGYYGGGYYGTIRGNNANYGPRPKRGVENGIRGTGFNDGGINAISAGRSRAEQYNPANGTTRTNSSGTSGNSNARPARSGNDNSRTTTTNTSARPSRENDSGSRPVYTPPPSTQSTPPPSSSGGGSRAESGSSSSGGGGGRPTRGGGR